MLLITIASVPTFVIIGRILQPYANDSGLRVWLIGCFGLAVLSCGSIVGQWHQRPLMSQQTLSRNVLITFAVPTAVQWTSASALIAPGDEQACIVLSLLVLAAAATVQVGIGNALQRRGAVVVGVILFGNFAATAVTHGPTSMPAMVLVYGSALLLAAHRYGHRELRQRQRLVERSEELLATISTERAALSQINEQLAFQATHDMLMGIPNRELLHSELVAALEAEDRSGQVGLLFLDLDRFKFVNDTLGHQAGDALLVMVGHRVTAAIADEDAMVARVGGDELVVLMRCLESSNHLGLVADKLLAKFVDPFTVDGMELSIGSSIGMASSADGDSVDDLYRHADAALYEAKQAGRGRAVEADARLRNRRKARIRTESSLRDALRDGEIEAWIQPEVDLVSGEVVAGEALARWRIGDEIAHASAFIEVAERAGLLEPLMHEMLSTVRQWRRKASRPVPVGVNVSVSSLATLVNGCNGEPYNRPLAGLRFEISEADVTADFASARSTLNRARILGASIYIDDFGSGFSSLRMLSDLPIDGLKIDRSYVARLDHDLRVRRLVTTLVDFGRTSGIGIVAEGVETARQAEMLRQIGVDHAQGLLFSPAVEQERFDDLVLNGCGELEFAYGF